MKTSDTTQDRIPLTKRIVYGSLRPGLIAPFVFAIWLVIADSFNTGRTTDAVLGDALLPLILFGFPLYILFASIGIAVTFLPSLRPAKSKFLLSLQGFVIALICFHFIAQSEYKKERLIREKNENEGSFEYNYPECAERERIQRANKVRMTNYDLKLMLNDSGCGTIVDFTKRGNHEIVISNANDITQLPKHAIYLHAKRAASGDIIRVTNVIRGKVFLYAEEVYLFANGPTDGFVLFPTEERRPHWALRSMQDYPLTGYTNRIAIQHISGAISELFFYMRIDGKYGKCRLSQTLWMQKDEFKLNGTAVMTTNTASYTGINN